MGTAETAHRTVRRFPDAAAPALDVVDNALEDIFWRDQGHRAAAINLCTAHLAISTGNRNGHDAVTFGITLAQTVRGPGALRLVLREGREGMRARAPHQ